MDSTAALSISSSVYSTWPFAGLMVFTVICRFAMIDAKELSQPPG